MAHPLSECVPAAPWWPLPHPGPAPSGPEASGGPHASSAAPHATASASSASSHVRFVLAGLNNVVQAHLHLVVDHVGGALRCGASSPRQSVKSTSCLPQCTGLRRRQEAKCRMLFCLNCCTLQYMTRKHVFVAWVISVYSFHILSCTFLSFPRSFLCFFYVF